MKIHWPDEIVFLQPEHLWTKGDTCPAGADEPLDGGHCGCLGAWLYATFDDDEFDFYSDGKHEYNDQIHPFVRTLIKELKRRELWIFSIADSNDNAFGREQELADAWNATAEHHGYTEGRAKAW